MHWANIWTRVGADLAETLLSSGHPAEAAAACERVLSVGGPGAPVRLRALGLFGRAALLCGDQTRSAAATEEALALAADEDPAAFVAFSVDEVYRITTFIGPAQAQPRLEEFHNRALALGASSVGLGHPSVVPWAGAGLAAFHRSGARDEVASLMEWLESAVVGSPCRWPRAMAAFGRGLVADDAGDHAADDRAFEEALRLLRSVRLPLELGREQRSTSRPPDPAQEPLATQAIPQHRRRQPRCLRRRAPRSPAQFHTLPLRRLNYPTVAR